MILKRLKRHGMQERANRQSILLLFVFLAKFDVKWAQIILANERIVDELNYGTPATWQQANDQYRDLLAKLKETTSG